MRIALSSELEAPASTDWRELTFHAADAAEAEELATATRRAARQGFSFAPLLTGAAP
jgi:hypothetical protein